MVIEAADVDEASTAAADLELIWSRQSGVISVFTQTLITEFKFYSAMKDEFIYDLFFKSPFLFTYDEPP